MLLAGGVASVMARDVMACITCTCGELLRDNKSCKLPMPSVVRLRGGGDAWVIYRGNSETV